MADWSPSKPRILLRHIAQSDNHSINHKIPKQYEQNIIDKMTNSNNTYHDEDPHRFDDCVEGDTVSEGDTSDEEDLEASKNNTSTRRTSSQRKEGLELPSGSADGLCWSRTKNRTLLYVIVLTIVVVAATSAGIVGGIYASRKQSDSPMPSTTLEEEFASSSTINDVDAIPSKVEDENDTIPDSEVEPMIPKNDHLGLLDEVMDGNIETEETQDNVTEWPALVGMTGEEAKTELELLYGEDAYDIHILLEGSPVTRDYRFNRIRIFTNEEGVVTTVPRIG